MAPRRITIEVEPGSTPRGQVFDDSDERRPFVGWIGLLSSLSTFIDREPPVRRGAGYRSPASPPQ
jgi:hypothetical protein